MISLRLEPPSEQAAYHGSLFQNWTAAGGKDVLLFYRVPDGFLLRFPGRADFKIMTKNNMVICTPCPEISENILSGLYLNQVLPLVTSHEGELVMHASAVVVRDQAIAFIGPSGRGKSTLAAAFARAGFPFLADDGLCLKPTGTTYLAKPNQPSLRLWHDSESAVFDRRRTKAVAGGLLEKQFHSACPGLPFHPTSCPLSVIYLLGAGEVKEASIKQLDPSQTIRKLIEHAFLLDMDDRARHEAHFNRLVRLARTVECFMLDYPRRFDGLAGVIDLVLQHRDSYRRQTPTPAEVRSIRNHES